jgi:hypothetical protein
MPTASSVTKHPDRAQIEMALAKGTPVRHIAKRYGISIHTLYRYKSSPAFSHLRVKHVAHRLKAGADLEQLKITESEGILQNLALQRCRLLLVQDRALMADDRREVAHISDVINRNIQSTGRYLGEFQKVSTQVSINILVSDEYLTLRSQLMAALSPFPAARRAVALALQAAEHKAASVPPMKAELPSPPPVIDGVATEVVDA